MSLKMMFAALKMPICWTANLTLHTLRGLPVQIFCLRIAFSLYDISLSPIVVEIGF